jgi:hypothetical protein
MGGQMKTKPTEQGTEYQATGAGDHPKEKKATWTAPTRKVITTDETGGKFFAGVEFNTSIGAS